MAETKKGAAMWNERLDQRLLKLEAEGLSFAEIAERLGVTRNAAIGRFQRLMKRTFASQIARKEVALAAALKRKEEIEARNQKMIAQIKDSLEKGIDRNLIIARSLDAGASYQIIGDGLGLSKQRVHQIAS